MANLKKEIEQLTKELNKLRSEFGESNDYVFSGKQDAAAIEALNSEILEYKNTLDEVNDTWGAIDGILQDVKKEFGKASDGMKIAMSSFNRLQSISNKFQEDALGIQTMNSKEIKGSITSIQKEIAIQQKALGLLEAKKANGEALTKNEEKLVNELKGENIQNNLALKLSKERLAQEKNITKAMGLTGAITKGLTKSLEKIGFSNMSEVFEEASEAARETSKRLTDNGKKAGGFITKIKTMGSAFKVVGKSILKNVTDPLFLAGVAMKGLKMAIGFAMDAYKKGEEAFMVISDETTGISRNLGISQKAASGLANSVAGMGPTTAKSKASIEGIYKAMGSTEKLSNSTLKVFVKLNTFAGMSADSLAKFQKFAKKSGEDAGTLVTAMAKTAGSAIKNNKLAMTQRDLLEESADQSAYVKLQFAGQGPALVNAVAQSKALGLNMKSARDMASSLLNFEDSIAAEMEAELLTGKQLNLEEARALALKGDNVGAAKLIAEQVGGAAEFMSMNVIQQEALAKAAGMGVDEMSNMLSGQQDMKAEGDDLVKNQEDGIKAMTSQVSAREVAENRARRAAEGNIAIYKDMEKPVNAIKDAWVSIKNSFASMVSENITKPLGEFLSSPEGIAFIKGLPDKFEAVGTAIKGIITKVGSFMKKYPFLSSVLGAGALGGAIALKMGVFGKKDGSSPGSALWVKLSGGSVGDAIKKWTKKTPKTPGKSPGKGQYRDPKTGKFAKNPNKPSVSSSGSPKAPSGGGGGGFFSKIKKGISNAGKSIKSSSIGKMATSGINSVKSGVSKVANMANPMTYVKKYMPKLVKSKGFKKTVSAIPKIGKIASLAMIAYDLASQGVSIAGQAKAGADPQSIGKQVVMALGDLGGSVIGGILGSLIPIPGVGTMVGTFLGGLGGSALAGLIANNTDVSGIGNWMIGAFGKGTKDGGSAEDFIMQNGTMTKFRKDDVIVGGTNLSGGGANSEKTNQLLERLIKAVEAGGTVTLDGQKVGTAMVAGSYRMQ